MNDRSILLVSEAKILVVYPKIRNIIRMISHAILPNDKVTTPVIEFTKSELVKRWKFLILL